MKRTGAAGQKAAAVVKGIGALIIPSDIENMGKKTILIVEDDSVVRDLIKCVLEQEYHILEASTYSDAVEHNRNHIDLAIVDYSLPDGDGFDALKAVRKKNPAMPAIMITAYGHEMLAIKALREKLADYIKKPLSLKNLKMKVAEILDGKKNNEQHEEVNDKGGFITEGIMAYIENNYMQGITRSRLAKLFSIDRFKLSKIFNKKAGQSIPAYLSTIRLKKAAELLKRSDLCIAETAYFVGFESVEHFSRLFKKQYGVPPKEYCRLK